MWKQYDGPCMKNHGEKQDCNTLIKFGMMVHVYTNKHDKLMDTSIQEQEHYNAKIFNFVY